MEGVKGIVASRLVNRYHVPALLFSIEDALPAAPVAPWVT